MREQAFAINENPQQVATERHYTPQEVAEMWQVDESTVRRKFIDEPGVLKLGGSRGLTRRGKRQNVRLRIPASVLARYHREHTR